MARPEKRDEERRSRRISTAVTPSEYAEFTARCRRAGVKPSHVVRTALLTFADVESSEQRAARLAREAGEPTDAELLIISRLTAQLARAGNVLNQAVRALRASKWWAKRSANSATVARAAEETAEAAKAIQTHLNERKRGGPGRL